MQISSTPQFSGLGSYWAKRHPEKRIQQLEADRARQAKAEQTKQDKQVWETQRAEIREALATVLFQDKHGPFTGWDMLLLAKKSIDSWNSIDKGELAKRMEGVTEPGQYDQLIKRFQELGLIQNHHRWPTISWVLPKRGQQALKEFKKEFKKPRFKLGNFSFN